MLYNLSSRRSAQHFPSNGLSYTNDLELSHDDARNRSDSNRSNGNRAGSPLHFQPSTATFVSAIDIPSVKVEVSRTVHIQEDLKQSGLFDNVSSFFDRPKVVIHDVNAHVSPTGLQLDVSYRVQCGHPEVGDDDHDRPQMKGGGRVGRDGCKRVDVRCT
jgi:hypothetical protein